MIETIEVKVNNKIFKYSKGITVNEILTEHKQDYKYPIILARINNRLRELSEKIEENSTIEFLDLTTPEGNRAHINGLILVLLYAVNTLYGKKSKIRVEHSLDKGIYIKTSFKLTEQKLSQIKLIMKEITSILNTMISTEEINNSENDKPSPIYNGNKVNEFFNKTKTNIELLDGL